MTAWGILLLVVPLMLTKPWIMLVAVLAAFSGLIYVVFWDGWQTLAVVVIPTGLMGVVLLKLVMGGPIPRRGARIDGDGPGG